MFVVVIKYIFYPQFLLQLSILVHPDKNPNDKDRAQVAFDGIK